MTVCEEYWSDASSSDKSDTIVVHIKDVLLHMNFRIQDACGQCYDGGSTMTGTKNGICCTNQETE